MKRNNIRKIMNTIRKPSFYVTYVVTVLVLGGILWYFHQHELVFSVPENNDKDVTSKVTNELPLLPGMSPEWKQAWEAEWEKKMQAEEVSRGDEEVSRFVEDYPITEENRDEINQMLAKFEPIENKSDAEILQILMSFYPEDYNVESLFQHNAETYKSFASYYSKEQKVFAMVYDTHQFLQILRKSGEEFERDEERKRSDPDTFYQTKIQNIEAEISEVEARIQEADMKGETTYADFERNHLAALHERIEDLNLSWDFAVRDRPGSKWQMEIDARVQELLPKEIEKLKKEYPSWDDMSLGLEELLEKMKTEQVSIEQAGTNTSPSVSKVSDVLSSPVFDTVSTLTTAQSSFHPFRMDLEAKYFDVVISQALTPQQIDTYFPTPADRQHLKVRTSQMQKAVVSKIRTLVSEIPNATKAQKRDLARQLVNKNFDKDFAKAILSALEKETE